jgi:hypothetical protein
MRNRVATVWLVTLSLAAGVGVRAQRNDAFARVDASVDVGWLERVATERGLAEAEVPRGYQPKDLRQAAYLRLGAIGTTESIAAIHRIEDEARRTPLVPPTIALGRLPHPSRHFGDSTLALSASISSNDGITYGVVRGNFMGGDELFLISTRSPNDSAGWSRPLLIPNSRVAPTMLTDVSLTWDGAGQLVCRYVAPSARPITADPQMRMLAPPIEGPQEIRIVISAVTVDSDGDGWTDVEERRLGLRPDRVDSDGDGIPDAADVSPQYAPSPTESEDVEATILARTVFAGYGLTGARAVMLAKGNSRPLQLWGLGGPVLFGVDRADWIVKYGGALPLLNWKLSHLSETDATVVIGDFEGGLAAAGYTARLRKIQGEWIVVSYRMDWIS